MYGTLVAVPVLNPPGYRRRQRGFSDGADLNRLFPGKPDGNCGQVFVHNVMHKLIRHFEDHIDLHTASFGRINLLYVRANMLNALTHTMAMLQHPQIIVHTTPGCSAAMARSTFPRSRSRSGTLCSSTTSTWCARCTASKRS